MPLNLNRRIEQYTLVKTGIVKTKTANTMTPYLIKSSESIPETFAVETVLGCDLRCPECAVGGEFICRKKGLMKFDQFKIIADKIRPFCKYLFLHLWGEPMLNKDIFQMIQYAAKFTATNISTNGQSITPNKAYNLIRSGVTDIIVSIDGISQNVYEKYRACGNVEKAINTLRWLQHYNHEYGNKVCIMPQFIVMKHNQHEMAAFKALCNSLDMRPTFKSPYIRQQNTNFCVSDIERYQRPTYPDLHSLKVAMSTCKSVHTTFNILLDASVVACCHDYDGFTSFGNMLTQDVIDIWNSDKYRKFRLNVRSGNTPIFCIEKCMSYFLNSSSYNIRKKNSFKSAGPRKIYRSNLPSGSSKLNEYVNVENIVGSEKSINTIHPYYIKNENSKNLITNTRDLSEIDRIQKALQLYLIEQRNLSMDRSILNKCLEVLYDLERYEDILEIINKYPRIHNHFPRWFFGNTFFPEK